MFGFKLKESAALTEAHKANDVLTENVTYWRDRALKVGKLAEELLRERDAYKAEVDRLRPVRGDRGRFVTGVGRG